MSRTIEQREREERKFRRISYPFIPITVGSAILCVNLFMREQSLTEEIRRIPNGAQMISLVSGKGNLEKIVSRQNDLPDSCNAIRYECEEIARLPLVDEGRSQTREVCADIENSCQANQIDKPGIENKLQRTIGTITRRYNDIIRENPQLGILENERDKTHEKLQMLGAFLSASVCIALLACLEIRERLLQPKEK
ncbi:MAG: hypothetical protein ACP5N9_03295 [Candidatus Bilamarchaeum sp.]|jgi:hypothetical protein